MPKIAENERAPLILPRVPVANCIHSTSDWNIYTSTDFIFRTFVTVVFAACGAKRYFIGRPKIDVPRARTECILSEISRKKLRGIFDGLWFYASSVQWFRCKVNNTKNTVLKYGVLFNVVYNTLSEKIAEIRAEKKISFSLKIILNTFENVSFFTSTKRIGAI